MIQDEIPGRFIRLTPDDSDGIRNRGNVLIVSPHPDDDVIGAGGTMCLLAEKGFALFSLYITHGASPAFKQAIIETRQREALEALKVVGAAAAIFLNLSRTEVATSVREIVTVLRLLAPVAVYLPSPFERHGTHRAVTRATLKALKKSKGCCPELWGYSVWGTLSGLPGTKVVDISRAVDAKMKAIRKHKSQISYKNYDEAILARNRYEGICLETHKKNCFQFAETYLDMQELIKPVSLSLRRFIQKKVGIFLDPN